MSFVKAVMISVTDTMHHFTTCLLHIVMIDVDRLVVGRNRWNIELQNSLHRYKTNIHQSRKIWVSLQNEMRYCHFKEYRCWFFLRLVKIVFKCYSFKMTKQLILSQ